MSFGDTRETVVRRALVRGVRIDALAARRQAERLLQEIPERISGLDASAILCVRNVSVQGAQGGRFAPPAGPALRVEMERLARAAARPGRGPAPPESGAVLFANRAEL